MEVRKAGSEPIRENQLDKAGNPVGIKSLIADFVLSVLLPGMVAPVRPGVIEELKGEIQKQGVREIPHIRRPTRRRSDEKEEIA
jgi:hypothetical protein